MRKIKTIKKTDLQDMTWIKDPTNYEYVRESTYHCHNIRCKPFHKTDEKAGWCLIGYQKPRLLKKYPDGYKTYRCLYFWLKNYDRGMKDQYSHNGYGIFKKAFPAEAVKII